MRTSKSHLVAPDGLSRATETTFDRLTVVVRTGTADDVSAFVRAVRGADLLVQLRDRDGSRVDWRWARARQLLDRYRPRADGPTTVRTRPTTANHTTPAVKPRGVWDRNGYHPHARGAAKRFHARPGVRLTSWRLGVLRRVLAESGEPVPVPGSENGVRATAGNRKARRAAERRGRPVRERPYSAAFVLWGRREDLDRFARLYPVLWVEWTKGIKVPYPFARDHNPTHGRHLLPRLYVRADAKTCARPVPPTQPVPTAARVESKSRLSSKEGAAVPRWYGPRAEGNPSVRPGCRFVQPAGVPLAWQAMSDWAQADYQ